jgi:mannose-6-phosphate isomerase-like protein (cupin superfamily)
MLNTMLLLAGLLQAAAAQAPAPTVPVEKKPTTAPVLLAGDAAKTLEASIANKTVDTLMKAAMVEGGQASVAMLYRWQAETNGLIHSHATEIYYILEGSGTITTGGTLQNPTANDLTRLGAGVGQSGVHVGGTNRKVGPHDVVIVPGGMAHRFSQLDGPIKYLVYRFDPSQKN